MIVMSDYYISKKSKKEIKQATGEDMPNFTNIEFLGHKKYLEDIQLKDAVLICLEKPTPEFPDNLQGVCDDCGCDIYYRNYNEKANKKICTICGLKLLKMEKI